MVWRHAVQHQGVMISSNSKNICRKYSLSLRSNNNLSVYARSLLVTIKLLVDAEELADERLLAQGLLYFSVDGIAEL